MQGQCNKCQFNKNMVLFGATQRRIYSVYNVQGSYLHFNPFV